MFYHQHQTLRQVITIFFLLNKIFWMTKPLLEMIGWKRLWKTFLSLKPAEFYLRWINKLHDQCRELIRNKSEYTIDRNHFIAKLFIDKLYFTETEIFQKSIHQSIYIYIYIYIYICLNWYWLEQPFRIELNVLVNWSERNTLACHFVKLSKWLNSLENCFEKYLIQNMGENL